MVYNVECILNEMMKKTKRRVLIIRCGLLGDTIDSTAVVKPLVDHYGDELEIDWVTKPNLEKLFQYDSRINPLLIRFTKLPLIFNLDKLKIIIKSFMNPYDAIINLEVGTKFISLAKYTKSKVKVGLPNKYVAENIKNEHRVRHQLRILQSTFKDIKLDGTYPYLVGSAIDIKEVYDINQKYIVMCPTNSKYHKSNHRGYRAWPLKNWQELIDKVLLETDFDIVVTGNSSEEEFINQLNLNHSRIHNLCGKTPLPDLVELMKKGSCAIANDSGSVHVAGVSCQKVIALHGPTPFKETGPYGSGSNEIIEANLNMKCSPCYNTDAIKSCPSNLCMINLSADMVFKYVIK